ncbi:hypothetical protein ACOJBM_40290 [Rhizobium beringeri]
MERQRYAAMETSFANGGQLSASSQRRSMEPLVDPAEGIKCMDGQKGRSLLIEPETAWHKYSWLAEFISNIFNYRENTIATTIDWQSLRASSCLKNSRTEERSTLITFGAGIIHVYWDKLKVLSTRAW